MPILEDTATAQRIGRLLIAGGFWAQQALHVLLSTGSRS